MGDRHIEEVGEVHPAPGAERAIRVEDANVVETARRERRQRARDGAPVRVDDLVAGLDTADFERRALVEVPGVDLRARASGRRPRWRRHVVDRDQREPVHDALVVIAALHRRAVERAVGPQDRRRRRRATRRRAIVNGLHEEVGVEVDPEDRSAEMLSARDHRSVGAALRALAQPPRPPGRSGSGTSPPRYPCGRDPSSRRRRATRRNRTRAGTSTFRDRRPAACSPFRRSRCGTRGPSGAAGCCSGRRTGGRPVRPRRPTTDMRNRKNRSPGSRRSLRPSSRARRSCRSCALRPDTLVP